MEGVRIFYLFTLVLVSLNSCFSFTKFRVPGASYNEGLDIPQDMIEDYHENEYPINPVHAGKYMIREKHSPTLMTWYMMMIPLLGLNHSQIMMS